MWHVTHDMCCWGWISFPWSLRATLSRAPSKSFPPYKLPVWWGKGQKENNFDCHAETLLKVLERKRRLGLSLKYLVFTTSSCHTEKWKLKLNGRLILTVVNAKALISLHFSQIINVFFLWLNTKGSFEQLEGKLLVEGNNKTGLWSIGIDEVNRCFVMVRCCFQHILGLIRLIELYWTDCQSLTLRPYNVLYTLWISSN